MTDIYLYAAVVLFWITLGLLLWYFGTRKMKCHDPKGKSIMALYILTPYCLYWIVLVSNTIRLICSSTGSTLYDTTAPMLLVLWCFGTVGIFIAAVLWAEKKKKRYLIRNIIVYVALGVFISIVFMLAPYQNERILGDRYIIPYVRQHKENFDLERAKELTRDPNIKTTDGMPLLPLAIGYEKYDYADYLISIGADVDFYGEYGEWLTERFGSDEIEQYIESRGLRRK